MLELIARLEAATGPDRELDNLIAIAAGYTIAQRCMPNAPDTYFSPAKKYVGVAPYFTELVDAALTLVPDCPPEQRKDHAKNFWWSVECTCGAKGTGAEALMARVWSATGIDVQAFAKTPALAICLAALRAMKLALKEGR